MYHWEFSDGMSEIANTMFAGKRTEDANSLLVRVLNGFGDDCERLLREGKW